MDVDQYNNVVGKKDTLTFNIDEANLPVDIIFNIYDSVTDIEYDLNQAQYIPIFTDSLGVINHEGNGMLKDLFRLWKS